MEDTVNNTTVGRNDGLSPEARRIMTVAFSVEAVLGTICALYSLRRSFGRTPSGGISFFTSLAVADLGIALLCPVSAYASGIAKEGWPFSQDACDAYAFFAMFFGSASIWSSLMVVVEVQAKPKGHRRSITLLLAVTWLSALFWSTAPILGWGRYIPESYDAGCLYDMDVEDERSFAYFLAYPIGAFVLPLGSLVCATVYNGSGFKAALLVTVTVFSCWGLYCIEVVWILLEMNKEVVPIEVEAAAPIVAKLSPIVNALLIGRIAGLASPDSTTKSRKVDKKQR